jgi:hypothetical protein
VHFFPGVPQLLHEEELYEPVLPEYAEADPAPLRRERNAAVRDVFQHAELREPLYHGGDRGGFDASEDFSEASGLSGPAVLFKAIHRLEVIPHRRGNIDHIVYRDGSHGVSPFI